MHLLADLHGAIDDGPGELLEVHPGERHVEIDRLAVDHRHEAPTFLAEDLVAGEAPRQPPQNVASLAVVTGGRNFAGPTKS